MADNPHKCANGSSIDIERSRLLDDVGGRHFLCMVIDPQGDEVLALVDDEALDGLAPFRPEDWRQVAPHEMTGRLPRAYAPKCGCTTTSGRPCRSRVRHAGDRCAAHTSPTRLARR